MLAVFVVWSVSPGWGGEPAPCSPEAEVLVEVEAASSFSVPLLWVREDCATEPKELLAEVPNEPVGWGPAMLQSATLAVQEMCIDELTNLDELVAIVECPPSVADAVEPQVCEDSWGVAVPPAPQFELCLPELVDPAPDGTCGVVLHCAATCRRAVVAAPECGF